MIKPKVIHPRKVLLYKRSETGIDPEFGVTGEVNDELELEEDYTFTSRLKIIEVRPAAHYHGKNWHVHVYFTRMRTVSK